MTSLYDVSPVVSETWLGRQAHLLLLAKDPADCPRLSHLLSHAFPALRITPIADAQRFARALEERLDVVVTDDCLGWIDGLTVLHAVKTRVPHCRVIMCTTTSSVELAVAAMKSGADDYVVKTPQSAERLLAAVRDSLTWSEPWPSPRPVEARQAHRLQHLVRYITQSLEPAEVAQRIADGIRPLLGTLAATVYRVDATHANPEVLAVSGRVDPTDIPRLQAVANVLAAPLQRSRTENALRANEARYRTLFEEVPLSLWEADFSGVKAYLETLHGQGVSDIRIYVQEHPEAVTRCAELVQVVDVNSATLELFQITNKARLPGCLRHRLVGEAYRDLLQAVVGAFAAGRERFEADFTTQTATGQQLHVCLRASISRDHAHTWGRVLISLVDVTQRRLAERELQVRLEQLQGVHTVTTEITRELDLPTLLNLIVQRAVALVDAAAQGAIWLWDETRQLLVPQPWASQAHWLSHCFPQRLGEGAVGTVAQRRRGLLLNDYQQSPHAVPIIVEHTGATAVLADPLVYRDRLIGVILLHNGQTGRCFAAQDTSLLSLFAAQAAIAIENARLFTQAEAHRTELERRVEARTADLARKNRELEAFAYSVSHDLRAPLRSVSGFSEIIDRRYRQCLNAEGQRYLDNIIKASALMERLIDDMLAYSRVGGREVRFLPIPLHDMLTSLLDTLASRIEEVGARMLLPRALPVVSGDPTLLRQICLNLLDNALTYRRPEVPLQVSVQGEAKGDWVVIRIADNRIGIAPEYHVKIFHLFQRLHSRDAYPWYGHWFGDCAEGSRDAAGPGLG